MGVDVLGLAGAVIPGIKEIILIYVKPDNPKLKELENDISVLSQNISLYALKIKEGSTPETQEIYDLAISRSQMLEMRVKIIAGTDKNIRVRDTVVAMIKLVVALAMMIK